MRRQRKLEAEHLLRLGHSKSEVARKVGLSPSRISAMFPSEGWDRDAKIQKLVDEQLALYRQLRRIR